MTHGSLSTGIGGFEIGAKENGIETLWTCEIDPLRRDVLNFYLPDTKHYEDLRKIKPSELAKVDIISFGFPCQDISQANPKGKGLDGEKSGLWYAGWKVIRRLRPKVIVIENSPILLHKGLRTILGQLASAGYDAEWQIIPCKAFGLPHLRKRPFIVGYSNKIRREKNNRIQSRKLDQIICPEGGRKQLLQSEFNGNHGWKEWAETIRSVSSLDDGIPKNILYGLLAGVGDTVSPRITSWIFSCIKKTLI
jgi:DNA (cytosine-5)-methyltransferase 1